MAAKKSDPRGPVVLVTQRNVLEGPEVWFPITYGTPERRIAQGLRNAIKVATCFPEFRHSVYVQERGEWVTA